MCKFSKYNLKFLALKGLFDAFSLVFINNGDKTWFLTFFMQIRIKYLNNSLVKSRTASIGVAIRAKEILKMDLIIEI